MSALSRSSGPEFLVVALSGRALASAAARAGRRVAVVDLFADDDTRRLAVDAIRVAGSPGTGFDPAALAVACRRFPGLPLLPGAGFEHATALLARIARGRPLLGTPPDAVRAIKDPRRFARLLARLGVPHPETRLDAPARPRGWLTRQRGGAGGEHIRHGVRHGTDRYFQRIVPGTPHAVALLGDGKRARAISISAQWPDPAPGTPFRYGGAVAPAGLPPAMVRRLADAAETVAGAAGLVGLGSADFLVDDDGVFTLLEINPRPGATLDILDRPGTPPARTAFALHLAACAGRLPARSAVLDGPALAAAVVYARAPAIVPARMRWPALTADLEPPGSRLRRGAPVCTVMAQGATPQRAREAVARKALAVQARLDYS